MAWRPIIALVIAAVVVVAIAYFLFRAAFGGGCDDAYCPVDEGVEAPAGFELVSDVFEYRGDEEQPAGTELQVTLPLREPAEDGRNLSFHLYEPVGETWESAGPAILDEAGEEARGVFETPPTNVAVLRRVSSSGEVVAYIHPGETLHPSAVSSATIIHPVAFTPSADGNLAGELFAVPGREGADIYPVVRAGSAVEGSLPNVEIVLADASIRSAHVGQIVRVAEENDLAGIDLYYTDLRPDQRSSFTLLVSELAGRLHAQGRALTLTLPHPVKAPDRIDEGAYNWAALAQSADLVKMTPYRDQSTYRIAMPEILEHLGTVIEPSKLVMMVTPLASEKSPEGLRTLDVTEAMTIATQLALRADTVTTNSNVEIVGVNIDAAENLTGMRWDTSTATVAFSYKLGGGGRTVWIENDYSVGFKLEYVNRYGLGGVAIEDASENVYRGSVWRPLEVFIESGQPPLSQPNQADLTPRWSAEGGMLEGGERGVVTWITPTTPGTYRVFLTLSDGVNQFESEIAVSVLPPDAVSR